jgi:hypothetical protein
MTREGRRAMGEWRRAMRKKRAEQCVMCGGIRVTGEW